MTAPEADLTGWTAAPFSGAGYTHDVYRKGEGPGVVLIPEMPGIHPGVLGLGNHLVDNGFTVACPSLYGTPGARGVRPGAVPVMLRGCVAKESRRSRRTPTGPSPTTCVRWRATSTRRHRARVSV
jgi:dienelactone hydrolase